MFFVGLVILRYCSMIVLMVSIMIERLCLVMSSIRVEDSDRLLDIVFDDDSEFRVVASDDVTDLRWHMLVNTFVERVSDGKFYRVVWNRGLTENQDHEFYEFDLVEVERKVRMVEVVSFEPVS